jgi:hypothetical protein
MSLYAWPAKLVVGLRCCYSLPPPLTHAHGKKIKQQQSFSERRPTARITIATWTIMPQSTQLFSRKCLFGVSRFAKNFRGYIPPKLKISVNCCRKWTVAKAAFRSQDSTQLNSTGQLGKVLRCERAYNSTQLNSTQLN